MSFPPQVRKSYVFPSSSRDEGRLPCFTWKGMPKSPSHLERRLVSTCHRRGTRGSCHSLKATYFPIHSRSGLIPLHRFECQPRINSQQEGSTDAQVAKWKRVQGQNSTRLEPEAPLTTREESRVPCLHTRRDLTPCLKRHTQPETHVRTRDEL